MTSIQATINSESAFGAAAKRIDIWHEGGGIGRWELMLDNISGASQILSTNLVASVLGINGTVLMKGYVDDVLPEVKDESAIFSKYVKVTGRNYGRDLANLFLIYNYTAIKFDDLVDNALLIASSEITYTSPHTAPVIDLNFNKSFLQTGFVEAAQRLGYDFIVDNAKALTLWPLASAPSSGVLLKSVVGAADNNILLINPETKAGVDIRNYIRLDAGTLNDHYTEGNAIDFSHVNCTVDDDSSVFIAGTSSIKATITSEDWAILYLQFPNYNHQDLDFSEIDESGTIYFVSDHSVGVDPNAPNVQIYLKDDAGNEITKKQHITAYSSWQKIDFKIGIAAEIGSGSAIREWMFLTGSSFTWRIKRIGIRIFPDDWVSNNHVWIDGLKLGGVDVWACAQDIPGSQATYGRRMIPINRTDVKSQVQLQAIADNELANRKDPIYKLNLTCTLQTGLLYAGYLVDVLAPTAYIGYGSTPVVYRILSIHHAGEPGANLCKWHDAITELELILHDGGVGADPTRFKLASSPQVAINTRYDSRLRVLEGSLTGSGSIVGGGGGGGAPDWMNVPFIKVLGNAFFEDLTQLECTCPTYTWAQLEPYLWGFNEAHEWTPDALTLPLGDSYLRFKDDTVEHEYYIDAGIIFTEMAPNDPTLFLSQHLIVKKDVSCVALTAHQGVIALGSGWQAETDMPQILCSHATEAYGTRDVLEIYKSTSASPWKALGKIKVDTLYADTLKKVNGDAWTFPWDGGIVTGNIIIEKATPILQLKNTSGNPELHFNDGANLCKIYGSTTGEKHLRVDVPLVCEVNLACNNLLVEVATGTAPIAVNSTTLCANLHADNSDHFDGHHWSDVPAAYITSVNSPLSVSSGVLSIAQASTSVNGYLSSTDWNTFNNKLGSVPTITYGMTDFADQLLRTDSSPTFLTVNTPQINFPTAGALTIKRIDGVTKLVLGNDGKLTTFGEFSSGGVASFTNALTARTKAYIIPYFYAYYGTEWHPYHFDGTNHHYPTFPTSPQPATQIPANCIKFTDSTTDQSNYLFIIHITDYLTNDNVLCWDNSMMIQKDLSVGGFVSSNQGVLALGHGMNNYGDRPRIWLTHSGVADPAGGYFDTLYLTKFDGVTLGNLKCGNVGLDGSLVFGAGNGTTIISNDLVVHGSLIDINNATPALDLNLANGDLRVSLGFNGTTTWLNAYNGAGHLTIATYNNQDIILAAGGLKVPTGAGNVRIWGGKHLQPQEANTCMIGDSTLYFYAMYSNWYYGKNNSLFGCERSKSGEEWAHEFSMREQAEEYLTHEITKTKYHVEYDVETKDKIVCTCGKSVSAPCPEHVEEWNDKYTVNTGKMVQASSFLTLELDAEVTRLHVEVEDLRSQIESLKKAPN